MLLSKESIETLIDVVEIKLSCVDICEYEDSYIVNNLERCRDELCELIDKRPKGEIISFDDQVMA